MNALELISNGSIKDEAPKFAVGDTVVVHVVIKDVNDKKGAGAKAADKEKTRIQRFEGTVIAKKHGGVSETFTVRRVSYGVGVERVFPLHSPSVAKVEVIRTGKVRRAKLYYLRGKVGKAAKIKTKFAIKPSETAAAAE